MENKGTDKNTVKVALDIQEILSRLVCVSKVRSFQKMSFIWEKNVSTLNSWDTLQEIQEIFVLWEYLFNISDIEQIRIIMVDNYHQFRVMSNDSQVNFLIDSITQSEMLKYYKRNTLTSITALIWHSKDAK